MSRTDAVQRHSNSRERGYSRPGYFNMDFLDDAGIKLFRSQEGDNFIAIIPPEDPDAYFGLQIFAHFNVGYADAAFLCPRMMEKGKCPLCEEYRELKAQGDADDELMRTLNPYPPRYLYFVVDMTNAETEEEGIQLYDAPMTVDDEIMGLSKDRRTGEVIDISDPVDGFTLSFERAGKGLRTKYRSFKTEERDPLLDSWLKAVPEFEDVIVFATYDEMKEAYFGSEVEEKPARRRRKQTEDEEPRRGASRPERRSRRSEPDVMEEIEEELDEGDNLAETRKRLRDNLNKRREEEDAEEETERQPRHRTRRRAKPEDDEGDDF